MRCGVRRYGGVGASPLWKGRFRLRANAKSNAHIHSERQLPHDPTEFTNHSTTSGFVAMSTFEPVIVRTPLLHENDFLGYGTRCHCRAASPQIPIESI